MTHRFDNFSVDTRTRRLLSGDQEVHLSPKAFDLLTVLVENRRQAMSKADLQRPGKQEWHVRARTPGGSPFAPD